MFGFPYDDIKPEIFCVFVHNDCVLFPDKRFCPKMIIREAGLEPATYRLEVCRAAIAPHTIFVILSLATTN